MPSATQWGVAIARLGLTAAIACIASGCLARSRPSADPRDAPAEDPPWTAFAARVHAGRADAVATELRDQCARGSGAACSALADLIELRLIAPQERESAGDLYLRACGRGHDVACLTVEQRVTWLTLPLLQARHTETPRLLHTQPPTGPDTLEVDVCVDGHGVPARVHLRGSTGRDVDDHRLARAASEWRFAPLAVREPRLLAACARFVVGL